jgi:hypothetical protein
MKMKRKEKIILLVAVAGIVALSLWLLYSWLYLWPEKAIQRELAKIRARGEPVTLEELAPPEIPDAQNAALIYEQAFAHYQDSRAWRKISQVEARELAEWTEEDTKIMREYIEENEDCLRFLHQAAEKAKCQFDLDYTFDSLTLSAVSYYGKMRNFTRLIARDALYKANQGQIEGALESLWAGFRIGKALGDQPILTSQLVRYATDAWVVSLLQKILNENNAEQKILRRLLNQLNIEESREAFCRAIQGERCFNSDLFDLIQKDPSQLSGFFLPLPSRLNPGQSSPSTIDKIRDAIFRQSARLFPKKEKAFFLKVAERMIELAKLPYHQSKAELHRLERDIQNAPFYYAITKRLVLNTLQRIYHLQAAQEAKIGLAQLALGLKIYKAEKGKYPDTLADLVPGILPELPKDPFTGKDFVYKGEAEGFLVYSLNENAKDEGGIEGMPFEYDLPWRCKR